MPKEKLKTYVIYFAKKPTTKLSFSLLKSSLCFSVKDAIPADLKSFVVYKFCFDGCNASYVYETTSYLMIRIIEYILTDKSSIIFKHLESNVNCTRVCNKDCFSLIDQTQREFKIKIKGTMHIEFKYTTKTC